MTAEPSDLATRNLNAAQSMLERELVRHDTKASLLIAINAGTLALAVSLGRGTHTGLALFVLGLAGSSLLVASLFVLLISIRPHLAGSAGEGWELWSSMDQETLVNHMEADRRTDNVLFLSCILHRKFKRLRLACDLQLAGLTTLVCAALTTGVA
ncbi:Pycsar system effector family protein [Streptomyces tibetensis]|uniref:Pycsar system effector family protein n=1 Tax=Streptomyces tibetensis TaxID=2382123 RepID=UPI0033EF009D